MFSSSILCKVLVFIGGMIIVRLMSKADYGAYTYVMNCYGMLTLLYDLGCSSAAMQFCNENHQNPEYVNGYFVYGYKMGMLFSGITALLLLCSPLFYPFQQLEASALTASLCLMPFLTTTNGFLLTNLRIKLENKKYAIINVLNTVVHYLVILPLAYNFGIRGAVWSNYLIALIVMVCSVLISKNHLQYSWRDSCLSRNEKRTFLKLSFASQLDNGLVQGLVLMDVFLIGIFIADNEVISSYKVGTTIPTALAFIPTCMMVCVVPYFARHCGDIPWVKKQYKRMIALSALGNLGITLVGIALAPWMLPLLFGKQYADAVPCFQILMIGYYFSATFRVPTVNVLYTQRQVRDNIRITLMAGIVNCILDVVLILRMGSIGAAIATTAVQIFSSGLCLFYLKRYFKKQEERA